MIRLILDVADKKVDKMAISGRLMGAAVLELWLGAAVLKSPKGRSCVAFSWQFSA